MPMEFNPEQKFSGSQIEYLERLMNKLGVPTKQKNGALRFTDEAVEKLQKRFPLRRLLPERRAIKFSGPQRRLTC